jgi:predicted Ser/Thr protein kinase
MPPINLINCTVGEYRVIDFIGAGGMGEVYQATHTKIGRMAAIKVLTHVTGTAGMLERFFNEAKIQASLHHPNIATLYDFAEINGLPCIIMEYVDGMTLAERVRPSGPLPLAETLYVFQAVVEAITYMHNHGVVHRDIKSNNIKLGLDGQVKLLDFGIAKADSSPGLTATGSVIGTLEYLSPEQLMGGTADARSDIWALGVLLYEMVTGRVPFEATTLGELCEKIKKVKYPPPVILNPAVAQEVAAIIARCLKKNPKDRYHLAQDLLDDTKRLRGLVPAAEGRGIRQTLAAGVRAAQHSWAARTSRFVAAAIAGLVVVVGIGWYLSGKVAQTIPRTENSRENLPADEVVTASATDEMRDVTIGIFGGEADVYDLQDRLLKHITGDEPYQFRGKVGSKYQLLIKREQDEIHVNGEITDHNNSYHY